MKKLSAVIALGLMVGLTSSVHAEDPYKRAVMNYQAHHYSAALADLEKLVATYPNNAMVRYYRALSYQGTNQISLAKKDFEWVATNCPDGRVKQLGAAGLRNLGNYRSSVSGSSSGATVAYSSTSSAAPSAVAAPAANPGGKLSKILEFTSATCPTCITFAPIFEQTRGRFPGVDMQQLDVADSGNASLVSQYSVRNYPTIVFLSASGQVLFQRAGAPTSVDQFSQLIAKYR